MKHFWMGLAVACASGAVLALWRQHYDAAFVIGTAGALAWLLNYRSRMKELIGESNDDQSRHSSEDR
jgi:hypothetical protein